MVARAEAARPGRFGAARQGGGGVFSSSRAKEGQPPSREGFGQGIGEGHPPPAGPFHRGRPALWHP
eukprot:2724057-Lingulodinium_polyedra.AAC.1